MITSGQLHKGLFVISLLMAIATPAMAQGTVTLPLSNVTNSCLNVSDKAVDFWILSARVPKDENWLTSTNGVGARVDVRMSGIGQPVSFPAAASISTKDMGGKIIRTSLYLHVLAKQDLWNSDDTSNPIKTTDLSVPLTFARIQGSSNTAKVMQALIAFTNSAVKTIPPNPYVQGAQLVGQLATSITSVFQPDPHAVSIPNFALSFSLSEADSNCSPNDLQEGVGAEISDFKGGTEAAGIIQTAQLSNYCFYKIGQDRDPDIGFTKKTDVNSSCPKAVPANWKTLNNPQFIWAAYGTCKTAKSCGGTPAPTPAAVSNGETAVRNNAHIPELMKTRVNTPEATRLADVLVMDPAALHRESLGEMKAILNSLALCKSVGITAEHCLDTQFHGIH